VFTDRFLFRKVRDRESSKELWDWVTSGSRQRERPEFPRRDESVMTRMCVEDGWHGPWCCRSTCCRAGAVLLGVHVLSY